MAENIDGEQTRDFVNVRDVAEANWLAATRSNAQGCYNIGSGQTFSINCLTELLRETFGINTVEIRHETARSGEVRHCTADVAKTDRDMGFQVSVDLCGGLGTYIGWFRTGER